MASRSRHIAATVRRTHIRRATGTYSPTAAAGHAGLPTCRAKACRHSTTLGPDT
ncbi:hypothetical protein IP93_00470 [Lysobacter ruishenii]|uniref:Uncharacterized protein n=1 Tax=Aerolutibacter ruishenii TaxID=686800 RepID=A0A562M0J5_9GAMM|nr:hypothetical protein IP93_00470 [Lysobacter ruishenii]